ncbi:hypothetical protein ABZ894_05730 [Nocardia beijingensis]|uniref:hypothetical protein n=1 Tax=Nocardia beijingensis TaxID=95162 RepID=UPI0034103DA6
MKLRRIFAASSVPRASSEVPRTWSLLRRARTRVRRADSGGHGARHGVGRVAAGRMAEA